MNSEINRGETLLNQKKSAFLDASLYALIFLLLGFIVFFYFLSFVPITGESMENTMYDKQYCLVLRKCFDVERGDIVTIDTANNGEKEHLIVKRVVGTAGDKLVFMVSQDKKFVDLYRCNADGSYFQKINEPYIKERMKASSPVYSTVNLLPHDENLTSFNINDPDNAYLLSQLSDYIITVNPNCVYFLGDNRNISRDSRYYGMRTLNKVTAKVLCVL
ncbi:signal peptidase I [Anaerocaecibacter muris]|uniref:signal peptidase I n=1 Tax=Anaerocaecibacter muris TaxID=2941513 RepID=UPI0020412BC8|nr:signal peptidase I [Anaerocaecibacter muris]